MQSAWLNYVWSNNEDLNVDRLCSEVNYKLQCQFIQKWNIEVYSGSKYIKYHGYKTEFTSEKYVTERSIKISIALAKFNKNDKFPIEKGTGNTLKEITVIVIYVTAQ